MGPLETSELSVNGTSTINGNTLAEAYMLLKSKMCYSTGECFSALRNLKCFSRKNSYANFSNFLMSLRILITNPVTVALDERSSS